MSASSSKFTRSESRLRGVRLLLCATSLFAVVLACPRPVRAEIDVVRPELHLDLGFHGDLGFGARIDFAIVPDGLLLSANDDLAISPGIDLLFDDGELWIALPVALQWNFYLSSNWSLFPELGFAILIDDHGRRDDGDVHVDFLLAVGARYHWNARNAVVFRIGWPIGLQVGVTF